MLKFDETKYLKGGALTMSLKEDIADIAEKVHKRGYSNIVFIGIGGTWAQFHPIVKAIKKYSSVNVFLENATELLTEGNRELTKDSIVITASTSGNTKEVVEAISFCKEKGIEVIVFTGNSKSPLAQLSDYYIENDVGDCEDSYLMFYLLVLKMLQLRDEFDAYDRFVDQMHCLHKNLIRIREEFDPIADEIAKKYYMEPYNLYTGSGMLWGETYLFTMCILEEMQWIRTKSVTSSEFFHGTLEIVEPGVPVFVVKGEDENRKSDERVENFCKKVTDKVVVFDTLDYKYEGIDDEFRVLLSPCIITTILSDRLQKHYEFYTKHDLKIRRYYKQFEY
ncbi:MAG: SIS domain-containing protein [Erysipelotrichaceae bacterium]